MRKIKNTRWLSPVLSLTLSLLLLSPAHSQAQEAGDEIIERAMKDELERSMNELSYENYEKPFYISYRVQDIEVMSASASLGALVQTNQYPAKTNSVRVLVGDYDFNDESLDVASYHQSYSLGNISMPVENDYYGIRRALWTSTEGIYKSAAKIFAENRQYVKEQPISLKELPHRRFVKTPVVQLTIDGAASTVKKEQLEALVRDLSAAFKGEEAIHNSMVSVNTYKSTQYFLSSEGSKVRNSAQYTTLMAFAEIKTEKGEPVYEQIVHHAFLPEALPSKDELKKELAQMIDRLKMLKESPVFEESYYGPVLFLGESAGSVFSFSLFGQESLVASHDISTRNNYGYSGSHMEDKIGTRILDTKLTVKSLPRLKAYEGVELMGSFEVDAEGVVPPEELVLVEDGKLLALLNDRTATAENHQPNGHSSEYQQAGPGVIQVSAQNGQSHEALKAKLIALAKEEGLPYALMVKQLSNGNYMAANVYKVSLEDGSEALYRLGNITPISMKELRSVEGLSDQSLVYHSQMGRGRNSSYIVPDALLLGEVEIEGNRGPYLGKEILVENPVKKKE